ncbi:MAG: HAMP domain-containing histidine kinase [Ruminococcus sp.]|nr:HAMP domain-containing histidine kinase [Ruminococcus sp.]
MEWLLAAAVAAIMFLWVKVFLLKKSAREIADSFEEKLKTDTNTLIDISSRDKDMRHLADSINVRLKELRQEHLQYHQGNTELKNAITNISHDIRTPLTAIYGYLDMIQQTNDPEKQAKYIAIMKDRAELMKHLTEELFRYSVIIADETDMETEDVFVNQVLAESISSFYPALSEKGITPQITITEKRIIRNVNRAALSRVFSNLLNNAVKYSDGDLQIALSDAGEITFSNTAKELSAVEVEQLFDRFYTVEAAHHSTGLGLSIARSLVKRMGGSIHAAYREGKLIIQITMQ